MGVYVPHMHTSTYVRLRMPTFVNGCYERERWSEWVGLARDMEFE